MAQAISKMETTQTAVQWLALRYHHRQGYLSQEDIEQAKEMEKEQIIDAVVQYLIKHRGMHSEKSILTAVELSEQYYNKTYNK